MLSIRNLFLLVIGWGMATTAVAQHVVGYSATTESVIFEFDLRRFWLATSNEDGRGVSLCNIQMGPVYVAGSFNAWKAEDPAFRLTQMEGQPLLYTLMVPKAKLGKDGDTVQFKFVLRGTAAASGDRKKQEGLWWAEPSKTAANTGADADGNKNLFLKVGKTQSPVPPASASVARTAVAPVQPTGGYLIKGMIQGANEQIVYLRAMYGARTVVDSVVADKGVFVFTGTAKEPDLFEIAVGEYRETFPFILENQVIEIKGSLKASAKPSIKAGKEHALYLQLKQWEESFGKQQKAIITAYKKAEADKNTAMMETLDKQYDSLDQAQGAAALKLSFTRFKGHVAGLLALYLYGRQQPLNDRFAALDSIPESLRQHRLAVTMRNRWEKERAVTVGKAAPAFSQADTSGHTVSLADFKGKYVLIDFWASWCGPCRAENPNVVAAYQQFHPKGLEILGVSLDTKREAWIKAIHADSLIWSHVSDLKGWQNAVGQQYSVSSIPQNFLLDKEGNIIAIGLRGEDLKAKLAELMP